VLLPLFISLPYSLVSNTLWHSCIIHKELRGHLFFFRSVFLLLQITKYDKMLGVACIWQDTNKYFLLNLVGFITNFHSMFYDFGIFYANRREWAHISPSMAYVWTYACPSSHSICMTSILLFPFCFRGVFTYYTIHFISFVWEA